MRKIGLLKLQNLLFVLFLFALTGCGASNGNIAGTDSSTSTTGKITAKFDWAADGKSTAKTVAAVPTGVLTVRLKVTGPTVNGTSYTRVKASFPAADGGGEVAVTPGTNLIVTAEALGAGDVLLYEGFKRSVVVTAGATTNLGTISMAAPNYKQADETCLGCHENSRGITGQSIVADYKGSRHYSVTVSPNPKWGVNSVGCAGCHGPEHNSLAPSTDGRCAECHTAANGFGSNTVVRDNHYRTINTSATPTGARYLNATYTNCSACHEPHNLSIGNAERSDWAASGHGDTTAAPWAEEFWGNTCNACHTAGGFVKALTNGWTNTTADATTPSYMPLNCDGCHSSNDFKNSVRTLPSSMSTGYAAGMGGFGSSKKATIQFYDVGESNVCIPCHAGRENGDSLKVAVQSTYSGSFKNPHYLAAAATFYGVGGFQFYTSGARYQRYGTAGKVGQLANWSHGKLGMANYSASGGNDLAGVSNNTGNKGQCIACHLGPKNTHSFGAIEVANASIAGSTSTATVSVANGGTGVAKAITRSCYGCHKGNSESINTGNGLPLATIEQFVDEEKEIWNRMFDFFAWQLEQYGIYYSATAYPYFYSNAGLTTSYKYWNRLTVGTTFGGAGVKDAQRTMGVCMNLKLLVGEKGSFVHNRTFGRALISDSLAYLQKGDDMGSYSAILPTQNSQIKFSDYSSARPTSYPGQVGPNISITTLKSYLTRSATGGYTRR